MAIFCLEDYIKNFKNHLYLGIVLCPNIWNDKYLGPGYGLHVGGDLRWHIRKQYNSSSWTLPKREVYSQQRNATLTVAYLQTLHPSYKPWELNLAIGATIIQKNIKISKQLHKCCRHAGLTTHMESTFSSGPCTWPVTVPLLVFFTQPTTPLFLASPSVYWFQERKQ